MKFFRVQRLFFLTGLLSLFVFAGDIAMDALADAQGEHCSAQSSRSNSHHENTPCSHCSCAIHNGAVVASNSAVNLGIGFEPAVYFSTSDQSAPPALPASIDHPPQLG